MVYDSAYKEAYAKLIQIDVEQHAQLRRGVFDTFISRISLWIDKPILQWRAIRELVEGSYRLAYRLKKSGFVSSRI